MAGLAWDVMRGNGAERHSVFFPVYYRRKLPGRTTVLTPIGGMYARGTDRTAVYGLYYRRKTADRDGRGLLPLFFHDAHPVEGGRSSHTVAVPLYLRRRTPSDDLDVYTPLVWRSRVRGEKPRTGLAVVPFYFRQRQRGGVDVDAGVPFFFSRDPSRRTHTYIVATGFHRLSRKGLHTGVAPLWWWYDSQDKRRLLSLPAIFHFEDKTKDEHTTIAVPLWFDRQRADGRRRWAAFPFVFGGRTGYDFSRVSLAPVGYFDMFRLQRNTRFTGYVPLLFRFQKGGFQAQDDPKSRYTLWGSAPLFLYGKDGLGRRTHAALVYYYDRKPGRVRLYTPVFGVNNEPGKALGWYAANFGLKITNTHVRSFFFPLWYRKKHRLEDTSLTLALPPLFVSRHREDRRFLEAGMLFWQWRQQHKVSTAVVPPGLLLLRGLRPASPLLADAAVPPRQQLREGQRRVCDPRRLHPGAQGREPRLRAVPAGLAHRARPKPGDLRRLRVVGHPGQGQHLPDGPCAVHPLEDARARHQGHRPRARLVDPWQRRRSRRARLARPVRRLWGRGAERPQVRRGVRGQDRSGSRTQSAHPGAGSSAAP